MTHPADYQESAASPQRSGLPRFVEDLAYACTPHDHGAVLSADVVLDRIKRTAELRYDGIITDETLANVARSLDLPLPVPTPARHLPTFLKVDVPELRERVRRAEGLLTHYRALAAKPGAQDFEKRYARDAEGAVLEARADLSARLDHDARQRVLARRAAA